jgi:hypothetical protein
VIVRVDMHCHTGWGSGDTHTDPNLLIRQAKAYGLDALCFTEHNQLWDFAKLQRLAEKHEFTLFPGMEVDTDLAHVLVFGLREPRRWLRFPSVEELRRRVDEAGGAMIVAHPFRKRRKPRDGDLHNGDAHAVVEEALTLDGFGLFDAVEVFNGLAGNAERRLARAFAERLAKPTTGGSDTHRHPEVGATFTVFDDPICNERELIEAIKAGRMRGSDWAADGVADERHERIIHRG